MTKEYVETDFQFQKVTLLVLNKKNKRKQYFNITLKIKNKILCIRYFL
jgi:hypothetical protein